MEEARLSIPYSQRKYLERAWDTAVNRNEGNPRYPLFLGKPTPELISEISTVLGRPVRGKKQIIELGYLRHINNRHGVGGSAIKGKVPVTKEIFTLIIDILQNFDFVEKGHRTGDADGVLIHKRYSDGNAVMVNAVTAKGKLEIKSLRVEKIK